jgi:hypothetical protein
MYLRTQPKEEPPEITKTKKNVRAKTLWKSVSSKKVL